MSGEVLCLEVSTLAGHSAKVDVSRTQSVADVLRQCCIALGLQWLRGVYQLLVGDLHMAEARDGSAKLMQVHYPTLFAAGPAQGCLIRRPNALCPGQQCKVSFILPKELQHNFRINQIHEMEGIILAWHEGRRAWFVQPYSTAGLGGDHHDLGGPNSDICLIEPRHLRVKDPATRQWVKPDILDGDTAVEVDRESSINISQVIDEALEAAAEIGRRRDTEFDNRRRTVEWAEQQSQEREVRLLELTTGGRQGIECGGGQQRGGVVADARWEDVACRSSGPTTDRKRIAALAVDLESRILPLYLLRYC